MFGLKGSDFAAAERAAALRLAAADGVMAQADAVLQAAQGARVARLLARAGLADVLIDMDGARAGRR